MTKRGAGFLAEWAPRFVLHTTIQRKDGRMGQPDMQPELTTSKVIGKSVLSQFAGPE